MICEYVSTNPFSQDPKQQTQDAEKLAHLLLKSELRIIKLSSSRATISAVSPPLSSSSPLALKLAKLRSRQFQSVTTWLNLASMSFSLTADMQIS